MTKPRTLGPDGTPRRTVTVHHSAGHTVTETWERAPEHCPRCGKADVWCTFGHADYYCGESFLCAACGQPFTIQVDITEKPHADRDPCAQRLAVLRRPP